MENCWKIVPNETIAATLEKAITGGILLENRSTKRKTGKLSRGEERGGVNNAITMQLECNAQRHLSVLSVTQRSNCNERSFARLLQRCLKRFLYPLCIDKRLERDHEAINERCSEEQVDESLSRATDTRVWHR